MSAASDKARFYLEQSVPELKEYERKGIFSPEEITSIARKRSDFEHKINARGSTPADFARYAEFEINVDALRRKRVKRLGIKATNHNGKRRIFFVFDRGVRKHAGDVALWMQAIEFARKQKAYKKLQEMFTNVLRLHPTKSDLWIYAAQFAIEDNGDMTEARSYMQRGLRFCKNNKNLWLEYGRLEMSYIAKILARREVLGITGQQSEGGIADHNDNQKLTTIDVNPQMDDDKPNAVALQNLESTPAMGGAIPIAIFDSAMAQFNQPDFAFEFFNMVSEYDQLPTSQKIAGHIADQLTTSHPGSWQGQACHIHLPLVAVSALGPEFPAAFRQFLSRLRATRNDPTRAEVYDSVRVRLGKLSEEPELDQSMKAVIASVLHSLDVS